MAIQLAAAFEVGLQVTRGVPAWASQYQAIQSFFDANVDSWLSVAQLWVSVNTGCVGAYYGNNLAFEPMFDLARLEQDPGRLARIRGILGQNMWSLGMSKDKSSWFAYIFAANAAPGDAAAVAAIADGNAQLAQFTPPPRVHLPVTNSLPAANNCPAYAAQPIDVAHRVISDFDWQRDPRQESDPGNTSEVYPGVDYLCAYWLGRQRGFLSNDAPARCTRWLP